MSKLVKLQEIAHIEISNVDKKEKENETKVFLCNFVDVYHNWAIKKECAEHFMQATANDAQIQKFSIHSGQVAITKDSETRDDIGVPTYIADELPNTVLGYHCALITPQNDVLDGAYLNVILHTSYAQKYFEANASGSGQRYTLTNEIIGGFPVPLIEIAEQREIASAFSNIDDKILNNNSICSDLEAMAKLLYDYWFVQFDFPDENGKPYKTSGGKMDWNETLKREIPEGWESLSLQAIADIVTNSIYPKENEMYSHYSIPAYDENKMPAVESGEEINSNKYLVPHKSVLVSKLNPQFKRIWYVNEPKDNAICSTEFLPFISKDNNEAYLFSLLNSDGFYTYMVNCSSSSTGSRKRMEPELCLKYNIPYPNDEKILNSFCGKVKPILEKMEMAREEIEQLSSLRDFLLPMLMNGQVKIKDCNQK